ncbi:proton-coupled folate transporter-like [Strongylocentrotus purpuratus]|uniref:Proton-coupled folate transporter n=1 Tax=Strongylocentrotus purpuratus TaxID=7668 RepID=A0A7M7PFA8_STRPU|nr:proton-coupled folate transporter-like [Strongylocentrotus purpuratus]
MEEGAYEQLVVNPDINDDLNNDSDNPSKTSSINGNYITLPDSSSRAGNDFQVSLQRARSRHLTVEVPLLLVALSLSILGTLRSEYLRERVATDVYHVNVSMNDSNSCGGNTSSVEDDIQATTSTWLLYLGAIQAIPGLFMAIILGSVSDRLGRKPALALCVTGLLINTVFNIVVIYFHFPIPAFIPGDLIGGLCGGLALLLSTSAAYVCDVTSAKMRTFRIVVVETVLFVGYGIGQIALGFTLQYSADPTLNKYLLPLWISLGCAVASLVYILLPWLLIETVDRRQVVGKGSQISKVLVGIYQLIKENTNQRRRKVLGYAVIMMFGVFVVQSSAQVFVVYSLGEPFCLGPLDVSFVSVTSVISGSIGPVDCMARAVGCRPKVLNTLWDQRDRVQGPE